MPRAPNRQLRRMSAPTSAILRDRCGCATITPASAVRDPGTQLRRSSIGSLHQKSGDAHAAGESRRLGKCRSNAGRVNIAHSAAAARRSVVLDRQADELAHPVTVEQQQHVALSPAASFN